MVCHVLKVFFINEFSSFKFFKYLQSLSHFFLKKIYIRKTILNISLIDFLPVSLLQILSKSNEGNKLETIVAGTNSPGKEDVQSRVVADGSVKLHAFKSSLMIKSFFVERTSRQNQSRYFLPFQTKKKLFF